MKHLNKLVRDNMPEILDALGEQCDTVILSETDYRRELDNKLREEYNEYVQSHSVEELADIIEVVFAIAKAHGIDESELQDVREKKAKKSGRFDKRIMLKRVWKNDNVISSG